MKIRLSFSWVLACFAVISRKCRQDSPVSITFEFMQDKFIDKPEMLEAKNTAPLALLLAACMSLVEVPDTEGGGLRLHFDPNMSIPGKKTFR